MDNSEFWNQISLKSFSVFFWSILLWSLLCSLFCSVLGSLFTQLQSILSSLFSLCFDQISVLCLLFTSFSFMFLVSQWRSNSLPRTPESALYILKAGIEWSVVHSQVSTNPNPPEARTTSPGFRTTSPRNRTTLYGFWRLKWKKFSTKLVHFLNRKAIADLLT